MAKFLKLEKFFFYSLVFLLFFQGRFILRAFRPEFNEWTSAYLYLTDLLIAAVIFLWLIRILRKHAAIKVGKTEIAFFVFLGISGLSLAVSNNFWLSLYGFVKLVEFGALFLYVKNNFAQLFNLTRFWQIFVASASLQSVVAIWQFFGQKSLGIKYLESPLAPNLAGVAKVVVSGQNYIRAYGLMPHPNILAAVLILAIFGVAYLFIKNYQASKNWHKIIYGVALVLILVALFFTFSRAITAVGLALLIIWLSALFWRPACRRGRQKESRRPIVIFIVLLFTVYCLLLIVYWPHVLARYDLNAVGQSQAFDLRVYYNNVALDFIKSSPIFGIGQGNFVWANSNLGLLESWMYQPTHNIYLLIAAETGLLGLLAFLAFLFFTLKSAWKNKDDLSASCLLFIVYCLLLIGFIDHFWWDIQQGQIMFWLFLGILAAISHPERSEGSLANASKISPHSLTDKARPSGG
ncbi:O-antigen ligase family protein [Patescibacteria group bacterium]|nr:O-antigen ligase family protein [Patescibacteria group bacterium]